MLSENVKLPQKRIKLSLLSFSDDEAEEPFPLKKFQKNPETSKKTTEELEKIEEIKKNYNISQQVQSLELLTLSFAYWDGTNMKHSLTTSKSCTISEFLSKAKSVLVKDFPNLESSTSLMFVKEDMIIPLDYSFHDLIACRASGNKGLLFELEKQDDVWVDLGYTIKVLERKWYEKNKHIFPACKWRLFEPV